MALSHLRIMLCVLSVVAAAAATVSSASALDYEPEDLHSESRLAALFDDWNHKHGKKYPEEGTDPEKKRRLQIFKENLQYIHRHNSKGTSSFTMGLTRFADLTNEEFKASNIFGTVPPAGGLIQNRMDYSKHGWWPPVKGSCDTSKLPADRDWRRAGKVTGVKFQGYGCRSCWAFSAVGAIESAHAIATGRLISLSEQQLVNCDTFNSGCEGGWMDRAFEWVVRNGGISSQDNYAYDCLSYQPFVSISHYVLLEPYNELALLCAVNEQPVSVALHITPEFRHYKRGVFNAANCSTEVNHAVLIVGWGLYNGLECWIAKNSWGVGWGEGGYIYLVKGRHLPQGICGLHSRSSFPVAKLECCCMLDRSSCPPGDCCHENDRICDADYCRRRDASNRRMSQHTPSVKDIPSFDDEKMRCVFPIDYSFFHSAST